ncbi:MAG TPA: lipocalin family protein [Polyangiaceae bacterium]|nr:lipocalin family protein [Polyangiaceae bacterium]
MRFRRSVLALAAFVLLPGCRSEPPLDVAPVDLGRFQGKWYEIAKLPRTTESGCSGTTAFYRLRSSTELDVTNECRLETGGTKSVTARAVATDPSSPGKLSLDVGGFYGDYWVLGVGEHYEWAVIGHPSRDYLWILSRTPTLSDETLRATRSLAQDRSFDTSRLEYTAQP